MQRQELAEKLINTKTQIERKRLLKKYKEFADVQLAHALKDTYYKSWTNEPKKVQKAASSLKFLLEIIPNEEISALKDWVEGISSLTKGETEEAIDFLDKSAKKLAQIGKEHLSAQPQVGKLYALGLLGRYEEAFESGENALRIFEKFNDELAAGKVEMNLSNIVSRRGQHKMAETYCHSALKRFIKTKEKTWQTMAENGLANTYSELNDFHKAEEFYAKALQSAQKAEMFVTEAEIEASLGNLAIFCGKYSDALNYLELSRRKFHKLKMPHQTAIADLEIAEIYQTLNLTNESYEIYKRISESFRKLKLQSEEARTRKNFGKVLIKKREFVKARRELQRSVKLYLAENNPTGAASVKLSEVNIEISLNNYKEALKIIDHAKSYLKKSENLRLKLQADFLRGEVLRKLNKYKFSEKILVKAYEESLKNEQKILAQSCLNSLGKLALQKKDTRRAERYFKKSIKIIENLRSPLPAEEFRIAFLANNLKPFENLAKLYLDENQIQKAFIFIEKAKARSLAETIQAIGKNPVNTKNTNSKSDKKLHTLREELNWFYSRLKRVKESDLEKLQAEAQKREKQIAKLMRQIQSTQKSQIESPQDDKNLLKELQIKLGNKKALIEFVKFDDVYSAFVITDKKIEFIRHLAKNSEIISLLKGLQFQFGAMRYGAHILGNFTVDLKRKADFYLEKLYNKLLAPLKAFIKDKDLVIIPVSTLFYVPFSGLFDGQQYIIETQKIVSSPSAIIWKNLSEKPRNKSLKKALLIGFADEKIPLVNQEIKTLKRVFKNAKTFTDQKATFTNYTKNAENFDVIHFACHGQFRPDNPLFSSLHLADGFVTVRDICSQSLHAELVTLSACETGLNKIYAGDEILGLARGFLTAGVNSIILSLWTVNDKATKDLMKNFYSELRRGKNIAASLQYAQKLSAKNKKHPYFWASFGIIGK